jgi:hypothetical protein
MTGDFRRRRTFQCRFWRQLHIVAPARRGNLRLRQVGFHVETFGHFPRGGLHCHALAQFLHPFDNHLLARLEPAGHDLHRGIGRADLHDAQVDLAVAADHGNLRFALKVVDRALRDEQRIVDPLRHTAHAGELTGTQQVARVGKLCFQLEGTGVLADRIVHRHEAAGMRVDRAVSEENLQAKSALFLISDQFLRIAVVRIDVVQILVVADVKIRLDRIDHRDAGQRTGLRSDEVSDLRDVDADKTVDRRGDAGKFEVEAGLLHGGLGGGHRGLACFEGLDFIVVLLSADDIFSQQIDGALGIGLVTDETRHGLFQLAGRLVENGFERPGVDLEKKLAFFNQRPVLVILRNKIAADLGHDVGIDQAGKHTDPLANDGNFLLQRRGDRNRQFRHDGFLFFRTTREEQRKQSEQ